MIEPFFGSPSPTWTGIPSPGFGWLQAPIPIGNLSGGGAPGFGSPPQMSSMPAPQSLGQFGLGQFGTPGSPSPILGAEIASRPTASSLLATVAMRRGQPLGPTNDQEIEDFIYDTLELLPGTSEVEVRCEGGRATLTGSVQHKRLKRDVGELAWAIPVINDVQNNVAIATRRRSRVASGRESEPQSAAAASRK
jgi:hypothetical protein